MGKRDGRSGSGGVRPPELWSSRRERRRQSRQWYRRPAFLAAVGLFMAVLAAGAAVFVFRYLSEPAASSGANAGDDAALAAEAGAETPEGPPLSPMEAEVASMPLEKKVGQMMMAGFEGTDANATVAGLIQNQHIGSFILYARNIASQEQVAALNGSLQALAAQADHPAKLIIATDQEGGKTRRFESIGPYYSQPMIGEMPYEAALTTAQLQASTTARELKKIGINTNLAPVVDVSSGWGSVMDGRSYGAEAELVADLGASAVKGYNNATTISSPKHFPGHGSADEDSEEAPATVESGREELDSIDLLPFQAVIKAGAPMIMTAHLTVPALDPSGTPASLSRTITTELLRKGMAFPGVILTDDLEMGAITSSRSVGEAAVAALAAGADMVMVAHRGDRLVEAHDAIIAAVRAGKLKEADINKSVVRILEMKQKYRLEK